MSIPGLYRATVVDNADPSGLRRVRLRIPTVLGEGATGWAYPIGSGIVPQVNAPVWAAFEGGDPSFPVYLPDSLGTHTHPESDVTSLIADIASKASLSGASFTGDVSTTGALTASGTVSGSGLAGGLLSSATPLVNGAAAAGTSPVPSRQDHVHPTDTSRAASSHSHAESDVSGLVADLAAKAAASHSHSESDVASLVSDLASKAPLVSPALTGTPTAPTAAANTNTTQLATTAFVLGQANSTSATISSNGTQAAGTSGLYARADHVHPTDTSRAQDSLVVHLSGTETITGAKTFNAAVSMGSTLSVTGQITQRSASVPVVTVGTTAPSSPVTGDIWVDTSATSGWQTYTVTMTGWSTNGTLTGRYIQIGSLVHFDIKLTLGSSNTLTSAPTFTLPVSASSNYVQYTQVGMATMLDTGVATYSGFVRWRSSTTVDAVAANSTTLVHQNLSSTVPFSWGNGDVLALHGWYESA